jgi:hypothetical protein
VVTSLRRGEFSDVLKSSNNSWVFFRAEETPSAADMLQEDTLAMVRSYMERFEGGRIENWLVAGMEELLTGAMQQSMGFSEYVAYLKDQSNPDLPGRFQDLENINLDTVGPFSLNFNNMGGSVNERGLQLFTSTLTVELHPELYGAAESEVFWRNAFLTSLNTPSSPFTLGYSIIVLTPVEENFGDEESMDNIANFYQWGFMYNAIGMDINDVFMKSEKFENKFYDVFMPILFSSFAGNAE